MPKLIDRNKWILYKHTSDYELIKAIALYVKNTCNSDISKAERVRMKSRLEALNLYKSRNPNKKSLDSINHRINTLEFFMFGYEECNKKKKRFIFSPLGNLFLSHIEDENKLKYIFTAMLFAIQFEHPANRVPKVFQLYPFRLLFRLMLDDRLDYKLYSVEYAYIIAFVETITPESYEILVNKILEFRNLKKSEIIKLLKEDEHTYVKNIYEWQYYMQRILSESGIVDIYKGENITKLYHPKNKGSKSPATSRTARADYIKISKDIYDFIKDMLKEYSEFDKPLKMNEKGRLQEDIIKEIYSFYPEKLLNIIDERTDELQMRLLKLPKLIEEYSNNPNNETSYLFEDVLVEGFNMFYNVEAKKLGGAGKTDIECLYLKKHKKFAIEAKSTANKLLGINSGRLRNHRERIGGEYTIVITPRYVPATKQDIYGSSIVIILASTFSEYLYNHIYHDVREINYEDFDNIIVNNLGTDISNLISDMTFKKFATNNK